MSNHNQGPNEGSNNNEFPNIETQYRNQKSDSTSNFDQFLNLSPAGDTPIQTNFPTDFPNQFRPSNYPYAQVLANSSDKQFSSNSSSPLVSSQPQQLRHIQPPNPNNITFDQQISFNSPTIQQQFDQLDMQQQQNDIQNYHNLAPTPPIIIETPPEIRNDFYDNNNLSSSQLQTSNYQSQDQLLQSQPQQQRQQLQPQPQQNNAYLNIDFNQPSFTQPQNLAYAPPSPYGGSVYSELSSVENSPYISAAGSPSEFRDEEPLFSINDDDLEDHTNNLRTIDGVGMLEFNNIQAGLNNVDLSGLPTEVSFQDVLRNNDVITSGSEFDMNVLNRISDSPATSSNNGNLLDGNGIAFGDDGQNWKLTQDNLLINNEKITKQRQQQFQQQQQQQQSLNNSNNASPVTISIEVADHEMNFNKPKVESLFSNSNKSSRANSDSSQYLKSGHFNNSEGNSSNDVFDDDEDYDDEDYDDDNNIVKTQSNSYLTVDDQHSNMRQSRQRRQSSNNRSHSRSRSRSKSSISRVSSNASLQGTRDKMLELASPQQQPKKTQKHPSVYACHLCDKRFTRPYNLKSHLRTHTDERPFVCSVCGKAFARQHDRKRHEDLHSGNKKYQCLGTLSDGVTQWGCGKKFARTDALGRHFKTEAGKECIRPLVEESEREKKLNQKNGLVIPNVEITEHDNNDDDTLPAQLYDQYPSLAAGNR